MPTDMVDRNESLLTIFDACRCGYFAFITHIFEQDISQINVQNSMGETCLMICCKFNEIKIFEYLLCKKEINYLLCDYENNWNCLHYALRYGNFRIAQLLLNKPSEHPFPKYLHDFNGFNPFDLLPPNLHKKELFHDRHKHRKHKLCNSSFSDMLQSGECERVYGGADKKMTSYLQVQGVLYCWGSNVNNELGLNNNEHYRSTPTMIGGLRNISITEICSSGHHSIAISSYGKVFVWGNNIDGRCGLGYCSNEYRPFIKTPTKLILTHKWQRSLAFIACTATLDHSTLLTNDGNVYVFGCDRNTKNCKLNKIVKYSRKSAKLIWNKRLQPFCVSGDSKCDIRYICSAFERSVLIGTDNKIYLIGKSFIGQKMSTPTMMKIKSANRDIKNGIESACVGEHWLVLLLMNGSLLSMSKNKDNSESVSFSEIRLNKERKFKHYHNKREAVVIRKICCYNLENSARCIAAATNNDMYEWKAPSTEAFYIGNVDGIADICCAPKLCLLSTDMGECYGFGEFGLSGKEKQFWKGNGKKRGKHRIKMANIERIVTLSQIGKVLATKNSAFVVQSFLWPNRSLLNAVRYHKKVKQLKNKKIAEEFWNSAPLAKKSNESLYACSTLFSVLVFKGEQKEEKQTRNKGKKQHKKQRNKGKKHEKRKGDGSCLGLDEDIICKVPSLVSYCEDLLIQQIDIQTVISLYKQSYNMGLHRLSVFLSFVIIENIQHLLSFLLRDCSQDEVGFVEQLFKSKYFPQTKLAWTKYYGDSQYFAKRKGIIEQYRILPRKYPNYKSQLSDINAALQEIQVIEQKLLNSMATFEEQREAKNDIFDEDQLLIGDKKNSFRRALNMLDVKERAIYESKYQLLCKKNQVVFKNANPEQFPNIQMMQKWKRKQKKRNNYNMYTFGHHHKKNKKKFKTDKKFIAMGIADAFDADKYLKHVYLQNSRDSNKQKLQTKIGFSFSFDYDLYNKPKRKRQTKGVIYREFNVADAILEDAKKARKMDKKQKKKLSQHQNKKNSPKCNVTVSGAAKRRKRKKVPQQTHNKNKPKTSLNPTPKLNKNPRFARPSPPNTKSPTQQNIAPNASNEETATLSPIDVVRRNREKKLLEQKLSTLKNDVWDLKDVDAKTNQNSKPNAPFGSLSDILNVQKNQYDNEQKQKRHGKYVQYQESQNAWTAQQRPKERKKKAIRPAATKDNKNNKDENRKQASVVEIAQFEEMQFRSLAQHEYEWMIDSPQCIDNKEDDYDSFVKQQELLLKSFGRNVRVDTVDTVEDNNNREYNNRRYGVGAQYDINRGGGGRGRGGHRDRYNNNHNYRGRGRGNNRYYDDNRQYNDDRQYNNDNSKQWRRK